MRIHPFKKGFRALGIAESFRKGLSDKSVLAGVVMRKDLIIDGFSFSRPTLEGDDATECVLEIYRKLRRKDINVIMMSGAVISLYNIIDLQAIHEATDIPLLCLSYRESRGLEGPIKRHFKEGWEKKLEMYKKLGKREGITLKTGKKVYIRRFGLKGEEAKEVIDAFLLQGRYPEPIRVASLLAWSILRGFINP